MPDRRTTIKIPRRKPRMPTSSNKNSQAAFVHHILERNIRKMQAATISTPARVPIYKNQIKDSLITVTTEDQEETEEAVLALLENASKNPPTRFLLKDRHAEYLKKMLGSLPGVMVSLDASRPWCLYWALNAMALLGDETITKVYGERAAATVLACVSPDGGIGGSNGHIGHLAPTYAALNALALSGNEAGWAAIDRKALYRWLMSLKQPDGSFRMHIGGECDTRAVYCALAIASLLNILTEELVEGCNNFLKSCQTFEGGFSAMPGLEAHGGYAFCALASFCILYPPVEVAQQMDIKSFLRWMSARQHQPEGGFSGRTNKLVDGCYNHWVGGCWALLENILGYHDLWNRTALQNYTLYCCQCETGGLRDKPGKSPDAYHTNYTLAGLSGAQYRFVYTAQVGDTLGDYAFRWSSEESPKIEVLAANRVLPINPIHVVPEGVAEKMNAFYRAQDVE